MRWLQDQPQVKVISRDRSGAYAQAATQGAPQAKQVADRFKAYQLQLEDGEPLTGFIMEQTDDTITLAARDRLHRIPRTRVRSLEPRSTSLMPDRLLNALTDEDIRDLLTFLDHGIGGMGATSK